MSNCLGNSVSPLCPFTDVHQDPKLHFPLPSIRARVTFIQKDVLTGSESKVFPVSDIFTSLSLFTLNGHLCDRHLPLPWGLLDRLVDFCLTPASKCSSPCFPGAHWNLVFCELGQQKRQPAPPTWRLARGAEGGHGRHSVPWQPLPTEGRTATTSL